MPKTRFTVFTLDELKQLQRVFAQRQDITKKDGEICKRLLKEIEFPIHQMETIKLLDRKYKVKKDAVQR